MYLLKQISFLLAHHTIHGCFGPNKVLSKLRSSSRNTNAYTRSKYTHLNQHRHKNFPRKKLFIERLRESRDTGTGLTRETVRKREGVSTRGLI